MKKFLVLPITVMLLVCGCTPQTSQTRFLLDTVVTLSADCDAEVINGAFSLVSDYEKLLSRTVNSSEVSRLNGGEVFDVSDETLEIIEKAVYYSRLTNGAFDITVCSVSELWDFKNQVIPSKEEIAEALKNVDYEQIKTEGNKVNLSGAKIDLGGIAKGYIADKIAQYLKNNGAKSGIVNLGGNVVAFDKECVVGIQKPFSNDITATVEVLDKSVVTSGIYQRYIENGGEILHHIIDTKTGYAVKNELASVTVIGDSSFECDVLSTVCVLLGTEKATELIENTEGYEAVFIDRENNLFLTDGLEKTNNKIKLK